MTWHSLVLKASANLEIPSWLRRGGAPLGVHYRLSIPFEWSKGSLFDNATSGISFVGLVRPDLLVCPDSTRQKVNVETEKIESSQ